MFKSLPDLSQRLLSSALVVVLSIFLIYFSMNPWVTPLVVVAMVALATVGLWEYLRFAEVKGIVLPNKGVLLIGVLLTLAFFVAFRFSLTYIIPFAVLFGGFVSLFLYHFKDSSGALARLAIEFFGIFYVVVPIGLLIGILYEPSGNGRYWLFYLIAVTKITDVGGYFVGKLFGKKRFAPMLSPKKTIEGAVAGFLASLALSLIFYFWMHSTLNFSFSQAVILGLVIGIFSQVGDFAESLLKRDALVKDSNSLPGLGGVLDMIDSLLFTIPLLYFFLYWTI